MTAGAIPLGKNDQAKINSSDSSAGYLEDKIESSDGSVDIAVSSCGCTLDLSVNGGMASEWIKATVDYTDFNVASSSIDITPTKFTGLGAGLFVSGYRLKHSTIFGGSGASAGSLQIRFSSGSASSSLDVLQAVSNTAHTSSTQTAQTGMDVNSNDVQVRLFLLGDTGDNLTSGSADIWIKVDYLI